MHWHTDMRKGINGLALMAGSLLWDEQGFCLLYKCLDKGKFTWLNSESGEFVGITKAQLSMLIEGIDWRNPRWSNPPLYAG